VTDTETGGLIRLSEDSRSVSVSLDAPPAKVWSVLPAVYRRLSIPLESVDETSMTIGTRSFTQSRLDGRRTLEWARCGNQGAGPSSGGMMRTRFTILTVVRPASGDRTDLQSTFTGTATPVEGTSTGPVACVSTGDFEQRIRSLVLEEIAR
jgi:hypothetical protein